MKHALFLFLCVFWCPSTLGDTWGHYGGDEGGSKHSPSAQITRDNVENLDVAWRYQIGDIENKTAELMRQSALQTTPILVGDKLVACSAFNEVIALKPDSGKEIWRYDPHVPTDRTPGNKYTCRGVAHWVDSNQPRSCAERLYVATVDSRLIALDAATGAPCDDFGDNGQVHIKIGKETKWDGEFQITSAPTVAGDVVVIGSAISDNVRVDAPRGTVRAYDVRTGALAWTFEPIPEDDNATGAANAWAPMSYDSKRKLLFVPTSSPSPDHWGGTRPGNNQYANSVVALNADSGAVAWHFQTVHHDLWDYDVPAQPSLITLEHNGSPVDVVAQVTKTGFMFVLERDTGKPFFPVTETPVPQQGMDGEWYSPTQPVPSKPPPIAPQSISPEDAWGMLLIDKWNCESKLGDLRNEGLFTPPTLEPAVLFPFNGGGANWGGMSFDPKRRIAVVNTNRAAQFFKLFPAEDYKGSTQLTDASEVGPMTGAPYAMERGLILSFLGVPCVPPPWGALTAVDLDKGEILWEIPLGTLENLAPVPIPWNIGVPGMGGSITTAGGLVFIGASADDHFRAFDIETGEKLWDFDLPSGGQATPMTYSYEGTQYVVIASGGHGWLPGATLGDSIIAFKLKS